MNKNELIKDEVKLSKFFVEKYLFKEIKKNIEIFLKNEKVKNIKKIIILDFWVVSQFSHEYNPVHYHKGHLSGVGILKSQKI